MRKVKNPLPAPTECRYCGAEVRLVTNDAIYNGKRYGKWPYAYLCQNGDCRAYVGCHPNTQIPLGTLANAELRRARNDCKPHFERLWRRDSPEAIFASRSEAYKWLAEQLGIPAAQCHWGWFELEMCERAAAICKAAGSAEYG